MLDGDDRIQLGLYTGGTPASLTHVDRRRHLYLIGKTGTGKSTLLLSMLCADLARGHGFALLDPHGDLAEAVAAVIPPHRINETIYLDPADLSAAIGFNPVAYVELDRRSLVAAHVISAFKHIWGTSWGPRLEYILLQALRLLLDAPGSTLLGLPRLFVDPRYRDRLIQQTSDPVVRNFWTAEFASYSEKFATEAVAPIQNKIGALLTPPAIRNMLGQPRSTLDVARVMDEGQILIVNLSKGRLGEEPAHLLGALLTAAFAQAAEGRAGVPEDQRRDFTLYADEFQNFATETFASILSEARKYRLACVLAHQFLGQLPPLLRQAVFGNAGSMIAFRVGAEDAPLLANELGVHTPSALIETPNFAAWARLMQNDLPAEARRFETLSPVSVGLDSLDQVKSRTRDRFARRREIVESRIARFLAD